MKQGSTIFLKFVIVFTALAVVGLGVFAVPLGVIKGSAEGFRTFWVLMYLTVIPFYFALYQAWKLLGYIDSNTAFSLPSVTALNNIKYSALSITALYLACTPFVIKAADMEDAPGLVLMWLALSCAPIVVAVFAAVLQKLLQNGLDIKSENDLTV